MSVSNADLSEGESSEAGQGDIPERHSDRAVEPATPSPVVTECDLPDAPEKVWRALTVPKLLADWLPEAVGSEILEAEPNRLLRYRWSGNEHDKDAAGRPLESVVSFELTGTDGGGTHLRVVHRPLVEEPVRAVDETATALDGPVTTVDRRIVCLAPRMLTRKPAVLMACVQPLMRRAA